MDIRTLSARITALGHYAEIESVDDLDFLSVFTEDMIPTESLLHDGEFVIETDDQLDRGRVDEVLIGDTIFAIHQIVVDETLCISIKPSMFGRDLPCAAAQVSTLGVSESWEDYTSDPADMVLETV